MTDKDLDRRYPDAADVVNDLEDALAIEAARSGRATGEATAVLRTLPDSARRRLPLRMRRRIPVWVVVALLLLAVTAAVVTLLFGSDLADRAERGTGAGKVKPRARDQAWCRSSAAPPRTSTRSATTSEHPERARAAPSTTTRARRGRPRPTAPAASATRPGVGLYVDAAPSVGGQRDRDPHAEARLDAEIYVAPDGPAPTGMPDSLWSTRGRRHRRAKRKQRFTLARTAGRYRYYLVWITELPPGTDRVEISDVSLFAKQPQ